MNVRTRHGFNVTTIERARGYNETRGRSMKSIHDESIDTSADRNVPKRLILEPSGAHQLNAFPRSTDAHDFGVSRFQRPYMVVSCKKVEVK